jgi:hypothetical protein
MYRWLARAVHGSVRSELLRPLCPRFCVPELILIVALGQSATAQVNVTVPQARLGLTPGSSLPPVKPSLLQRSGRSMSAHRVTRRQMDKRGRGAK